MATALWDRDEAEEIATEIEEVRQEIELGEHDDVLDLGQEGLEMFIKACQGLMTAIQARREKIVEAGFSPKLDTGMLN